MDECETLFFECNVFFAPLIIRCGHKMNWHRIDQFIREMDADERLQFFERLSPFGFCWKRFELCLLPIA